MGQKRTYKQYSKEFKEEAVGLVRGQGYSVPGAAKSLGIASIFFIAGKNILRHSSKVRCYLKMNEVS